MESNRKIKYTIFEGYPSILKTNIPIFDLIIGAGYYIWLFGYFIVMLIVNIVKGPKKASEYIKGFYKNKLSLKGAPEEVDFNLTSNSIDDIQKRIDMSEIEKSTVETIINVYRGKNALGKLQDVIRENNLYDMVSYLPTSTFTLKEEILNGNFVENNFYITKGYTRPVFAYINFIGKLNLIAKMKIN